MNRIEVVVSGTYFDLKNQINEFLHDFPTYTLKAVTCNTRDIYPFVAWLELEAS